MADSACYISRIPLEVLLRITDNLKTPDLCSFRLACRSVEQSLYNTFTAEFFTRKQFMVSRFSLQALIDIAQSRLGQHLRVVQIATDHLNHSNDVNMSNFGPAADGAAAGAADVAAAHRRYEALVEEDSALWTAGTYRDLLAQAFLCLPNLEGVIVRDCNSKGRSRDGWGHEWTSYGAPTVRKETGVKMAQDESLDWDRTNFPHDIPSQVFSAVLHALDASGAPATGIEVIARNGWRLRDFAFDLPEGTAVSVLQRLEKLHLCIDPPQALPPSAAADGAADGTADGDENQPVPHAMLLKFLSRTPNIKNLRINECHSRDGSLGQLLERLAQLPTDAAEDIPNPPPRVLMPHLEELSLGVIDIEAPVLLALVTKLAPSLKSLELWKVRLQRTLPEGEPASLEVQFWPSLFRRLREVPGLELRHVKAGMLQQQWRGQRESHRVSFGSWRATAAYTGPDWRHFVGESVIPQLRVQWPPKVVQVEVESDSEGDPGPDPFD